MPRSREKFWRDLIDRQGRSGLSIAAFCGHQQVSAPSFYLWRKRLAEAPPAGVPRQSSATRSPFVEIPMSSIPVSPTYEIVLATGGRLIVPAQFDADSVRRLLALVEERSC